MPKSTNRKGSKPNEAHYPSWERETVETILGKAGTLSRVGLRFVAERIAALAATPTIVGGSAPVGAIPAVKDPKPKVAAVQQNTSKLKVWDNPVFDGLPCALELRENSSEFRSTVEGKKALSLFSSATALLARLKAVDDPPILKRKWKKIHADGSITDSYAHIIPKPLKNGSLPDNAMDIVALRSILASKSRKRKSSEDSEVEAIDADA